MTTISKSEVLKRAWYLLKIKMLRQTKCFQSASVSRGRLVRLTPSISMLFISSITKVC
jgi:hypothetical protein